MPDDTEADNTIIENRSAADIRKQKRTQRQLLLASAQQQHSQALCQNITKERAYKNSHNIACYIANDGEIDPCLIIKHAEFSGKEVYLPVLSPLKNSLYFAPYKTGDRLKLNRFKIPEPECHPSKWLSARQLDLLLLPLVAFDAQGNRLGMGGGFYDRTLAYLQHRRLWKKPALMGLAHEIQKAGQLNRQSWDIPLDYIITEKQRYSA